MSEVKISVIVPVYNTEEYLPRCLDSIIGQTFDNIEVIVVDDGSTDNSYSVCREYAGRDTRIRLFHKKNGGASSARNLALDKVQGEYIVFVDSDDYILKDALQTAYDAITANSAQMAVYGIDYAYGLKPDAVRDGDTLQEHDGGRQQALIAGQADADKTVRYDNYRLMRNYLSDREFYIGTIIWNKIYAAALWENRREKEGIMNEDADIMYRIIGDVENAVCIKQQLYIQCVREGSVTNRRFHTGRMNRLNIASDTKKYIKENYDDSMYGYAVIEAGNVCKDMLKELIAAGADRCDGDDGEVMRECYNRLLEYYKNNNSEMRKYRFRDYKKYLRIIACYVMRKHEWFTKYL